MKKLDSEYDVAALMESVDTKRWPEVRTALEVGGSGHAVAPDVDFGPPPEIPELAHSLYEEAVQIAETSRLMRQAARSLHGNLDEALRRIRAAERNIQELKDLGDIEFLEGDGDIEAFLKDATRMLRAAQGLKHTDAMGEVK